MAHSNSTFESAHDFQNPEDNNTVDGSATAALPSGIQPFDSSPPYEHDFSPSLNPAAQQFTPGGQHGGLEGPKLTATAPSFVPVKSKLNARAPSFLLSRLAIFDPPAGDLAERPRKDNLILPDARDDNITDSIEMMKCPQDGQVGRYTLETTINFNNGWHHNDPVLAAMYYVLNAKKKKNFSRYYFRSKTLRNRNLHRYDWKLHRCDQKYAKWITILPKGSPPTAKTVHIFEPDKEKWIIFGDWLEQVSNTPLGWVGRTAYSLQFDWWKYVGSKRRFEDLPGEIRTPIYQYALGGELYPLSTQDSESSREGTMACRTARLTLGMGYSMWIFLDDKGDILRTQMSKSHVPEARSFVYEPALELLLVSSWMREEVLHTGWELMRGCFFDSGIFHKAINSRPGPAMNYKYLSKVELAFTNADWFDFLGVETLGSEPYISVKSSDSLGPCLNSLHNLKDLRLRFRGLEDGSKGSPWGEYWEHWDHKTPYVCCQRTIVDWICTFVYPFLIDKCKGGGKSNSDWLCKE
ncbi:unnamed protein product [Alternaria alternata]